MADVVSFRFREHEIGYITQFAQQCDVDKSTAARELIEFGWTYYILMQHKEGKYSLEKTAHMLDISISELIDMLAELGITSPIRYEDYLEGLKHMG